MATTVDYILKVKTQQTNEGLKKTSESTKKLTAQTGKLGGGFMAAAGQAAILAGGLKAVIDLGGMFIGFVVDATKAVIDFSQASADLINDINDLSTRSAVSAESIKALQFAFKASGQDAGAVTQVLTRFPSILSQASAGVGRAAEGFKRLGVSVKDSSGNLRDSDTILRETLKAIQQVPDQTNRAALASDIFGRSAGQLLQALGQTEGLETFVKFTDEYGTRTGPKASKAAAEFQQAIAALDVASEGLKSQFIETFGEEIVTLIIKLGGAVVFLSTFIDKLAEKLSIDGVLGKRLTELQAVVTRLFEISELLLTGEIFGEKGKQVKIGVQAGGIQTRQGGAVSTEFLKNIEAASDQNKTATELATEAMLEFEKSMRDLIKTVGTGGAGKGAAGLGGAGVAADTTGAAADFTEFTKSIQSLDDEFSKTGFDLQGAVFQLYLAIENLPSTLEKAFKVSIAGIITDSILQAASGPSGFLNLVGDAFSDATMGISKIVTGAISGLAALGEKSPQELKKQFDEFPKNIEKGLEVLPRIIIQVLPRFIGAVAIGTAKGLLKLPFIIIDALLEAFKQGFEAIKEFFRSIFTKEGRQERREERRARKARGERNAIGQFFEDLFGTESGFMGGGRMVSGQGGLRFTQSRGLAMLHEGETIVPASGQGGQATRRMMSGARGPNINININSAVVENRAIDELVRKLESRFSQFGVGKSTLFGR